MRVVYLNPCGQMGGAETSLRELLAGVRAAAPDWPLTLVLGEDGPLAGLARSLGVEVVVEPFPEALAQLGDAGNHPMATVAALGKAAWGIAAYRRRLSRLVRAKAPDILHTNGFKMHVLGAWTAPRQTRLVWHIHDYVRTRPLMSRLLRLCARSRTLAIVNSKSVAADVRALLPRLEVTPIYNAVDLERYSPAGARLDLDSKSGLSPAPQGTVRVGLVATFARWKGHKTFLSALAELPPETPVRGYIIGGPIYQTQGSQWTRAELREEADRLGLGERIGFTGFLEDTSAAMRSLDVIVHASTQPEPFGMVIIEGMACGKAVIASQAGGAAELFVDGENALAHPPGDERALAAQILRLASDENLRGRLGRAGRLTAERNYHRNRLADELLGWYRRICRSAAARFDEAPAKSEVAAETSAAAPK